MNEKELMEKRNELQSKMEEILKKAKVENRAMNDEEIKDFDNVEKEIEDLIIQIQGACKNRNRHLIVPVVHLIQFMPLLKRLPLMST